MAFYTGAYAWSRVQTEQAVSLEEVSEKQEGSEGSHRAAATIDFTPENRTKMQHGT